QSAQVITQDELLKEPVEKIESLKEDFEQAMSDDFNTAMVYGQLFEAVRAINKLLDRYTATPSNGLIQIVQTFLEHAQRVQAVLGCFGDQALAFFERQKNRGVQNLSISEEEILKQIEERKQARLNKDFKRADEIRQQLLKMNIELKDHPDGRVDWSVKV
ncbi:MAG: cysteine--tRNA ligase, partial [Deltaproteobacteria bacterium]|nr:cysteine--tRNA ligase [Deltaproteobacteria bacterium]